MKPGLSILGRRQVNISFLWRDELVCITFPGFPSVEGPAFCRPETRNDRQSWAGKHTEFFFEGLKASF